MTTVARPVRLSLQRSAKRFSFERRVKLWLFFFSLPTLLTTSFYVQLRFASWLATTCTLVAAAAVWTFACLRFTAMFTRPLNTLANVVASLRSDDFSLRARGAQRGDAMGDLALEINLLASTLQGQRTTTLDALALVERVLSSMPSPVLAFDSFGSLRLINDAARKIFRLEKADIGADPASLKLRELLELADREVFTTSDGSSRWSLRRTTFRLQGVPHTLFVLTDVAAALRQEERSAWQRLIRVLSHEINNSLAPIQSIAGSLRTRITRPAELDANTEALLRGLTVIEERSASLHRFLRNYQQLARLPRPTLRHVSIRELLERIVLLETRLDVILSVGPPTKVECDPDQLEQAIINLVRNAVDAALEQNQRVPEVHLTWRFAVGTLNVLVEDNGHGLASTANLFVPFYTTKPEGSGIGLVLAQQIASAHGGDVTLNTRSDGIGCIAALNLPLTSRSGITQ